MLTLFIFILIQKYSWTFVSSTNHIWGKASSSSESKMQSAFLAIFLLDVSLLEPLFQNEAVIHTTEVHKACKETKRLLLRISVVDHATTTTQMKHVKQKRLLLISNSITFLVNCFFNNSLFLIQSALNVVPLLFFVIIEATF